MPKSDSIDLIELIENRRIFHTQSSLQEIKQISHYAMNDGERKKNIYIYSSLKSCNPWVVDYGFAFSIRVYIESFKNPTVLRKCILSSGNSYSFSSSLQSKSYRCRKIERERGIIAFIGLFVSCRIFFFVLLLSIYFECLSLFCACSFICFRMKELLSVVG